MSLQSRIYLNWDEASVLLGVDREGFRQLMAHKLSPYHGDRQSPWLPVVINSKDRDFFTHLQWDVQNKIPDLTWEVLHFEVQEKVIHFSDGTELPLKGHEDGASYEAVSDYLRGYQNCFLVGGEKLAVSPETVRRACENDGYVDDLSIAPYAWCQSGFSDDLYFRVLESKNSLHVNKPANIYDSTFFLAKDILRIKPDIDHLFGISSEAIDSKSAPIVVSTQNSTSPELVNPWPWGSHETDLLRKLADAAERFWKLYDPSDKSTAPTNSEVAKWLAEKGVSNNIAQAIATILRADDLPTGPRK